MDVQENKLRHAIIGMVIGLIAGIIIGATVVRPKIVPKKTTTSEIQSQNPTILKSETSPKSPKTSSGSSADTPPETQSETVLKPDIIRWRMTGAYSGILPVLGELPSNLGATLKSISDGKFEMTFHEPGTLVPPLDLFDAVRSGTIEAAFSSPALWAEKNPALQLFSSVPFGPDAREYLAWFYQGGGQKIFNDIYHEHGIHSLICGVTTQEASGWFKTPINSVDQLSGLRMRISGLGARAVEKLGVTTEFLTNEDILVAMNSGAIDAAEFSQPATDYSLGLHHTANVVYFPGWHQPATLYDLMINKDAWDDLSETVKKQIETACGDNIRLGMTLSDARQFDTLKQFTLLGVEMKTWPINLMTSFRGAWATVLKEQSRNNKDFKRTWSSLQKFREEFAIWQELSAP
jgi:TRAP-type mannitol/chloroaromatic compound transport system substrate-binding protein